MTYQDFPYIRVDQPIGEFYVTNLPARFANTISFRDERRRVQQDIARYVGIERPLNPSRVKEIANYVASPDASFPSSVILAIDAGENDDNIQIGGSRLRIKEERAIAEILDGQHRLAGLERADNPRTFDVLCSIFVNLAIEDRARIFATINLQQTKVNRSLALDLLTYAESRSPNKSVHEIIVELDQLSNSPFEDRIKRLGVIEDEGETLAQATFVTAVANLITDNDLLDRNDLLRKNPIRILRAEAIRYPLRKLWRIEADDEIAVLIYRYFSAVRANWPLAWAGEYPYQRSVIVKTAGFLGLMKALPQILQRVGFDGTNSPTEAEFLVQFESSALTDNDFLSNNIDPGTQGQNQIRNGVLGTA